MRPINKKRLREVEKCPEKRIGRLDNVAIDIAKEISGNISKKIETKVDDSEVMKDLRTKIKKVYGQKKVK